MKSGGDYNEYNNNNIIGNLGHFESGYIDDTNL